MCVKTAVTVTIGGVYVHMDDLILIARIVEVCESKTSLILIYKNHTLHVL